MLRRGLFYDLFFDSIIKSFINIHRGENNGA